jgi:outer membrane protein assembly factor BamE (lipoprotein component of BamABCDE complex)
MRNGRLEVFKAAVVFFLISIIFLPSYCFGAGSRFIPPEKLALLKENQTTKAEIIKLLGNPIRTTKDTECNNITLIYDNFKIGFMANKVDQQTVNLLIDNIGILKKISVNERAEDIKSYSKFIEQEKLSLLKSKENQFTKEEVINLIGKPNSKSFGKRGKGEIYTYYRTKLGPKKRDREIFEHQMICLFIDDAGVFKKICVNDKPIIMHKKKGDAVSFGVNAALTGLIPAAVTWLITDSYDMDGEYFTSEKLALLKENKTTKNEIIELYGRPDWNYPGEDGKGELYGYYYASGKIIQSIALYVDDSNTLQKITVTERAL